MKTQLLTVCLSALVACASPVATPPSGDEDLASFDPAEVAYILEVGPATIEGRAAMRRENGVLEPCRGTVTLRPAGSFSEHYVQETWGSTEAATLNINVHDPVEVTPELRAFLAVKRQTTCDAEGDFRFEGLVDGDYFVTAAVPWWVDGVQEGGQLMQRVRIRNGQSQTVAMLG